MDKKPRVEGKPGAGGYPDVGPEIGDEGPEPLPDGGYQEPEREIEPPIADEPQPPMWD